MENEFNISGEKKDKENSLGMTNRLVKPYPIQDAIELMREEEE